MSNDRTISDASQPPANATSHDLSHLYRGVQRARMPDAVEVARRLRLLREEVGYSVDQLAAHCGVCAAKIETFERNGSADIATVIALIAGFSWSSRLEEAFLAPRLPTVDAMLAYQRKQR